MPNITQIRPLALACAICVYIFISSPHIASAKKLVSLKVDNCFVDDETCDDYCPDPPILPTPDCSLMLDVIPGCCTSVIPGGPASYVITVKDQSGNTLSNEVTTIKVTKSPGGGETILTTQKGIAKYNTVGAYPPTETVTFQATSSTSSCSLGPVVTREITVTSPHILMLNITPSSNQTIPFGGSKTYTITVKDNVNGIVHPEGSTTIEVTNPFNSKQHVKLKTINGIATYTVNGTSAGTQQITFMALTTTTFLTGTGPASTVTRQVTVTP
jgi:hypothetical protein